MSDRIITDCFPDTIGFKAYFQQKRQVSVVGFSDALP
jgi:hypothetical protein